VSKDEDSDNLVVGLSPLPEGVSLPQVIKELKYEFPATKPLTHDDLLWRIGGYEPVRGTQVAGEGIREN